MWRSIMPDGRLSDMASLSWARNAVLVSAEREIEYAEKLANRPSFSQEKEGVFQQGRLPSDFAAGAATPAAPAA
jgi:hypothetical protein